MKRLRDALGRRGFTLLEVLMAVAILGLGLSVLLGAQTGLFANATRTEHLSIATGLARCKMSEVELDLLQKGYPLVEAEGEGNCCMGESTEGYTCGWKVQRVVMPEMGFGDGGVEGGVMEAGLADQDLSLDSGLSLDTPNSATGATGAAGPLGMLMQLQATKGQNLGQKPDISSLASSFQGSMSSVDGLASMVLGFVYPSLKPMLEESIRKVLITVKWKEGSRERTLQLTQYVTDPMKGGLGDGGLAAFGDGGLPLPGQGTGTGLGTSGGMFGSGTGLGSGLGTGMGLGSTPTGTR